VNLSYTEIRVLYLKLRADCTILQQHMNRNIQEGRMFEADYICTLCESFDTFECIHSDNR
jgi:hypothetical protein